MAELSRKERRERLVNEVFRFRPKEAYNILKVAQESAAELDAVVCQSNREFVWRKERKSGFLNCDNNYSGKKRKKYKENYITAC